MACRGPDTNHAAEKKELRDQIDSLTLMLCDTMKYLEGAHQDVARIVIKRNPDLKGWWEDHKKLDAERKAQEEKVAAEKAAHEKIVQSAKDVLSPEQLAALQKEFK